MKLHRPEPSGIIPAARGFLCEWEGISIETTNRGHNPWWVWLLPLPIVWWAALLAGGSWQADMNLAGMLGTFSQAMSEPLAIRWTEYSVRFLFVFTLLYGVAVVVITTSQKNYRRGVEHGSARWGNVAQVAKRYRDRRTPTAILY